MERIVKDRLTVAQVESAVEFLRKSDFRAVWRETTDKATAFGALLVDMLKAAIETVEVKPLKLPDHHTKDVLHQDVATAKGHLAKQGVVVNEIKSYNAALKVQPMGLLTSFPVKLKSGDKVDLYEENGVVRAYSIVKPPAPKVTSDSDVTRLGSEVKDLRSHVNDLSGIKADLDQVKASSQNTAAHLAEEVSAVKTRMAGLDEIRNELATVKAQSAQKDEVITALREELTAVRTAHAEFKATVSPERIAKLEQIVKKLQGVRARPGGTPAPARDRKTSPEES